jgi:nucleotide-binding universal stress UspA family protein
MAGLIVVGVDGSAHGREALRFALAEAEVRGARVGIVHSWSIPPLTATGIGMIPAFGLLRDELAAGAAETLEAELERVAGGAPGVELERHVVQGDAAGALVERAASADLLVVGSRGHGAVATTLLGSVSRACLHHAPCPVAVVNVAHHAEHARIAVGVDDSPGAAHALGWAFAEARLRGAAVHAVCAYEEPFSLGAAGLSSPEVVVELREALAEDAEAVVEQARVSAPADVVVTGEAVHGPAGQVLVGAAAGADLLVVGSRGRGGFKSLLLGSISQHCAAHAGGVVVVVRGPY